ncbi:hypothetical protein HPP92_022349 [Vanilla planifolia]|uniref:Uncharacterized protein n=1 Tax=Vanilla planifolia TaxID=51239 RepID=A0A835UH53_VANPL|nr:hypothetical protein HPP92_022349 [Vanilla planifolia]
MAAVVSHPLLILRRSYDPSHRALSAVFLLRSDVVSWSHSFFSHSSSLLRGRLLSRIARTMRASFINCSTANKTSPSSEISSTAKIRSEVLSPFRAVRMFFYIAFIASGALGGLIAITQLVSALANPTKAPILPEVLKALGIDVGAILILLFCIQERTKQRTHSWPSYPEKKASHNLSYA